ncbi:MAG: hypothetical protein FRX49_11903 [Trebouxia sp. A1-2]|nr:MAG: hypothetical protein FRX49_11903 [Trebouxia sp. A1-2]
MAGQPIVSAKPVSANAAAVAMLANDSDVVHVQLLDRMIVVPRAVVNGPILRNKITSPDGQAPIDQQGQAYLLFVDWKNFQPLLEYMCGNPVQLPSDKSDLLQLKNTARNFEAREFERLVTRHLRQLHGGGCSPFTCMQKPNKQMGATGKAAVLPVQQQAAPSQQRVAPTKHRPVYGQQPPAPVQTAVPTSNGTSLFKRGRPAKHQRAEKAFDTRQNQLYMAAHTQQSPHNFDLQQPLIV